MACSALCAAPPQMSSFGGVRRFSAASIARRTSSSRPSPLRAQMATTGTPSPFSIAARSMASPWLRTSSIMLRATTTGRPSWSS